jgi:hypothetical protein
MRKPARRAPRLAPISSSAALAAVVGGALKVPTDPDPPSPDLTGGAAAQ